MTSSTPQTFVLAGGCFWCLDAVYRRVRGVQSVRSVYTGGHTPHPDYESVCSGTTGHAEAVRVIREELDRVAQDGVTEEELADAKTSAAGGGALTAPILNPNAKALLVGLALVLAGVLLVLRPNPVPPVGESSATSTPVSAPNSLPA